MKTVDELLKSQSEHHMRRAADIECLRRIDAGMGSDLDKVLKAEAQQDVQKAASLERMRKIEHK